MVSDWKTSGSTNTATAIKFNKLSRCGCVELPPADLHLENETAVFKHKLKSYLYHSAHIH